MASRILIVDDELHIRRLLRATLERSGYLVAEAGDAATAQQLAAIPGLDAAFVDLGLPDRDGLELVDWLARNSDLAVLVISARDGSADRIAALDLGADDFVGKPFDTDELLARLRAALRRRKPVSDALRKLTVGALEIDEDAHIVRKSGEEVHLTPKEFAVLALLARNRGRVVTHVQILRQIWGPAHDNDLEYLRVVVRNLRLKLEDEPSRPALIRNEPGIGYRLSGA